jgi:hypothetical protein
MSDVRAAALLAELPRDPELGVAVPFACTQDDGSASVSSLIRKRVTQCALSRICGVCGQSLGAPVAFIGSRDEFDRLAFHFPPVHPDCGRAILAECADLKVGVLGQPSLPEQWVLATTSGFEHERPSSREGDNRPTFRPNSLISLD